MRILKFPFWVGVILISGCASPTTVTLSTKGIEPDGQLNSVRHFITLSGQVLPPSQTAKEQAKWAVLQNGCEYSKAQVKGREPTWHRIINPSDALAASRPELCDVAPNIQ